MSTIARFVRNIGKWFGHRANRLQDSAPSAVRRNGRGGIAEDRTIPDGSQLSEQKPANDAGSFSAILGPPESVGSSDEDSAHRNAAQDTSGAARRRIRVGLAVKMLAGLAGVVLVPASNSGSGLGQFSDVMISSARGVGSVEETSTLTMSSHSRNIQKFAGAWTMASRSVDPVITPHSDRRKLGEFGESPTGVARGNTEPSRWMKHAGGRCDGQGGPRKGMRPTSAQRVTRREEMTWPFRELEEAGNRNPAITMRSVQLIRPCSPCSGKRSAATSRRNG